MAGQGENATCRPSRQESPGCSKPAPDMNDKQNERLVDQNSGRIQNSGDSLLNLLVEIRVHQVDPWPMPFTPSKEGRISEIYDCLFAIGGASRHPTNPRPSALICGFNFVFVRVNSWLNLISVFSVNRRLHLGSSNLHTLDDIFWRLGSARGG